jgi:hypothetical protein
MTKRYNVLIYREMRLVFDDIEADSPENAAAVARDKLTNEAVEIDDCDGLDLSALVDEIGDDQYEHSVLIDFEGERLRKAAQILLTALAAILPYAENENRSLYECWKRDGDEATKRELDACERAVEQARAAITAATTSSTTLPTT